MKVDASGMIAAGRLQALWSRILKQAFRAILLICCAGAASAQEDTSALDVLNKRCVVCHGCYDAPCQLKLSSAAGWMRGASKQKVYDSSRLEDAPMTRLGIDAKSVPGWRAKGFFDVVGAQDGPSVLEQLLLAGRKNSFKLGAPLPDDIDISTLRANTCAMPGKVSDYLKEHPQGGMPFAMAPLADGDYETLLSWARDGAPAPDAGKGLPQNLEQSVHTVETFFNRGDKRSKLVARYIYEHLFLAHLHLEGDDQNRFFRVIRSRTASGSPPDEIASRRPFDDPGGPFHYRLIPIDGTILHKEHMVYEIGPERLNRYEDLFLKSDWEIASLPPYSTAAGGNPLSTFRAIPARSRYQFLLDEALYFVRSFIRGPVCYGQVAVNVIEDRFWVSFLTPDADLSVTDPSFLEAATPILELPVAQSKGKLSKRLEGFLSLGPVKYQEFRKGRYERKFLAEGGPDYGDIWQGDGSEVDARLTVYRNFSSASVVSGFVGAVPENRLGNRFPAVRADLLQSRCRVRCLRQRGTPAHDHAFIWTACAVKESEPSCRSCRHKCANPCTKAGIRVRLSAWSISGRKARSTPGLRRVSPFPPAIPRRSSSPSCCANLLACGLNKTLSTAAPAMPVRPVTRLPGNYVRLPRNLRHMQSSCLISRFCSWKRNGTRRSLPWCMTWPTATLPSSSTRICAANPRTTA